MCHRCAVCVEGAVNTPLSTQDPQGKQLLCRTELEFKTHPVFLREVTEMGCELKATEASPDWQEGRKA